MSTNHVEYLSAPVLPFWLSIRGLSLKSRRWSFFDNKTILISGATSGIGLELARMLAAPKRRLILLGRRRDVLHGLAGYVLERGAQVLVYDVDFNDIQAVRTLGLNLVSISGTIDYFISNAGKSIQRKILNSCDRPQDLLRSAYVNYLAPALLLQALLPSWCSDGKKSSGRVINVSTVGALLPGLAQWGHYQSSKTAMRCWFDAAFAEVPALKVSLCHVFLPLVHSPMSAANPRWKAVPGMSCVQAAQVLARAMISTRRSIAPWWIGPLGFLLKMLGSRVISWIGIK